MVFELIILAIVLASLLLIYVRSSNKLNIIDEVNERSSHSAPTPTGGGFVVPLATILFAVYVRESSLFITGLTLVTIVSFLDDKKPVRQRWRIIIQLISVVMLLADSLGPSQSIISGMILLVFIMGTLNAVNFMDGINGMIFSFGMIFLLTLGYLNIYHSFLDPRMLYFTTIGVLVFGIFNWRNKALVFSGDVGSIGLGFILVYFSLVFFQYSDDFSIVVLWTVFGVDSVLTIVARLHKRENIFKAHRSHLYQYYANEKKRPHLAVSAVYASVQLGINILFVLNYSLQLLKPLEFTLIILIVAGVVYIFVRRRVIKGFT